MIYKISTIYFNLYVKFWQRWKEMIISQTFHKNKMYKKCLPDHSSIQNRLTPKLSTFMIGVCKLYPDWYYLILFDTISLFLLHDTYTI